jgi:signal transduction histidine kinase
MEASVEKIGTSQSFEKHMEPSGHYKEIGSLIEANNRMLDRMNEVLREEEQFSSDVAHELRTPISVIKAQCQYVLGNCELDDEQRKSFEVILRQSNRLQELVQTLLELSRLERDKSNVKSEDIDLNEIVEAVCEGELIGNDGRDISFEYNCENAVATNGDISLVTIAVSNIVSNAVKFSPDGAVIYVETGENDDSVYVKVKDTGIGMSVEEREQIFKRFYKSDSSRNSKGYGLGMPLALKIAEKHGGTIEVESEPGAGSQFTLLLKKYK